MDMHETAKRLLAVGLARGAESFAEIARWLGESDQTATNWKSPKRGVSKQGVLKAAEYFGVDALWLSGSPTGKRPSWLPDGSEDAPSDIVDERRGAHHPNTAPGPAITGRHQKLIALFEALTPERQDQLIRDLQNAQQADEEAAERLSADRLEMILKRKKSRRAVETSQFAPTAPIAANPDIPALESP